jgi:hypothetical protein
LAQESERSKNYFGGFLICLAVIINVSRDFSRNGITNPLHYYFFSILIVGVVAVAVLPGLIGWADE